MESNNQLPLPLGLEWDDPHEMLTFGDIGTEVIKVSNEVFDSFCEQIGVEPDDDFLAGVSACGMSPEECEACQ